MKTIWRLWCILASFLSAALKLKGKCFLITCFHPIRNFSSLFISSLQRYVCVTSTRCDREKSHNNDRSFLSRVPHGFTRLAGVVYSLFWAPFIQNVLERKLSAKLKQRLTEKTLKHSPWRSIVQFRDTFSRVSSFGQIQNLKQKRNKAKCSSSYLTWRRYGEKKTSFLGDEKRGVQHWRGTRSVLVR